MSIVSEILKDIPEETKRLAQKQGDISVRIIELIKGKMTQRELAKELRVSESRLSKILSGQANLTLKTIIKLEAVLGDDIIRVPIYSGEEEVGVVEAHATATVWVHGMVTFERMSEYPHESEYKSTSDAQMSLLYLPQDDIQLPKDMA
jgi:transcriptional regulator with XRE-family HTH domain